MRPTPIVASCKCIRRTLRNQILNPMPPSDRSRFGGRRNRDPRLIRGKLHNHRRANGHPQSFDDRLREAHSLAVAPSLQCRSHGLEYSPRLYSFKEIFIPRTIARWYPVHRFHPHRAESLAVTMNIGSSAAHPHRLAADKWADRAGSALPSCFGFARVGKVPSVRAWTVESKRGSMISSGARDCGGPDSVK